MQENLRQKLLLIEYAFTSKSNIKSISNHKNIVIHAKIQSENVINASQAQQGFIV